MMYKLHGDKCFIRESDGAYIPKDITNRDYIEYLKWVDEGNVPARGDPIPKSQMSDEKKAAILLLKLSNPVSEEDIAAKEALLSQMEGSE